MAAIRPMSARIAVMSSANRSAAIIFSIHVRTSARSGALEEVMMGVGGDDMYAT